MKHHQSDPCWGILLDCSFFIFYFYFYLFLWFFGRFRSHPKGGLKKTLLPPIFLFTHVHNPTPLTSPRNTANQGYLLRHQTHCRRGGHSTSHQNLLRLTLTKTTRQAVIRLFASTRPVQLAFSHVSLFHFKEQKTRLKEARAGDNSTFAHQISSKPHHHGFSDDISGISS